MLSLLRPSLFVTGQKSPCPCTASHGCSASSSTASLRPAGLPKVVYFFGDPLQDWSRALENNINTKEIQTVTILAHAAAQTGELELPGGENGKCEAISRLDQIHRPA